MIFNSGAKKKYKILYIGGFELPDKNAAAQRVIGIAKALRELDYEVLFLNSLKNGNNRKQESTQYFDFMCLEYLREKDFDYLFSAKTVLSKIRAIEPDIVMAYNYPAFSLNKIRKYCNKRNIRCYVDATEWYQAVGSNWIYRLIKNVDTAYRMKVIHKKVDGVIAISRYLYEYYEKCVNVVLIPPVVDIAEEKWSDLVNKKQDEVSFVYAGSPSAQKERLDLIVSAVEHMPSDYNILLNIVGVNKEEFAQMYNWEMPLSRRIKFWGRTEHKKAIDIIKQSNWAIIMRENNKVVRAGFPTKLVESISCGTPVIVNEFSNICDYLDKSNSIVISDFEDISVALLEAYDKIIRTDKKVFDYHFYMKELQQLLVEET